MISCSRLLIISVFPFMTCKQATRSLIGLSDEGMLSVVFFKQKSSTGLLFMKTSSSLFLHDPSKELEYPHNYLQYFMLAWLQLKIMFIQSRLSIIFQLSFSL